MKCFYIKPRNYRVWATEKYGYDGYIFAETRGKAQYHAQQELNEVGFRDIKFTDVKLQRMPDLDKYFIEPYRIFDYDQVLSGGR